MYAESRTREKQRDHITHRGGGPVGRIIDQSLDSEIEHLLVACRHLEEAAHHRQIRRAFEAMVFEEVGHE